MFVAAKYDPSVGYIFGASDAAGISSLKQQINSVDYQEYIHNSGKVKFGALIRNIFNRV